MILNDISYVQVVPVDLYFSFAQTYFIICIGLMVMILYPRYSQYTGIELSTGVVFEICHLEGKSVAVACKEFKILMQLKVFLMWKFYRWKPIKNFRFKGINDDYFFNFFFLLISKRFFNLIMNWQTLLNCFWKGS